MFISNEEKTQIFNNIKFLLEEISALRGRIAKLEGWEPAKKKPTAKSIYKWASDKSVKAPKTKSVVTFPVPKKRGRPVGSKNKK